MEIIRYHGSAYKGKVNPKKKADDTTKGSGISALEKGSAGEVESQLEDRSYNMSSAFNLGMDIGDAHRRRRENNAMHQANATIDGLNARVIEAEPKAAAYQEWLAKKKNSPTQFSFEIFAEIRPDLRASEKDLENKRVVNLHLVAWSEWWTETVRGGELLAKEKAPKLRGLSDAIMKSDFQAQAVARAIEDIADRLELANGMANPRKWVENRAGKMYSTVKWKPNDPAVPIYSSLAPYPPASQNRIDTFEGPNDFNPIELNLYGINDMMLR